MSNIAVIDHAIWPEYVEVNKRYQCRMCHVWIRYDEGMGRWEHM